MDFLPDDFRASWAHPCQNTPFSNPATGLPKRLAKTSATKRNSSRILDPKRFQIFQILSDNRFPPHCCDAANARVTVQKFRRNPAGMLGIFP
jgi:hypothetical protein